jgi:predicted HicB family RNase H-like nuclease
MPQPQRPNISIRIDPEVFHLAKIGAVASKKSIGQWLEEAIQQKLEQERGLIEQSVRR